MTIEKLIEFAGTAETSDKNLDDLDLNRGFPSRLKPARQWFNWIFNSLTKKINEIIDNKLDSNASAVAAIKLQTARTITLSGDASGSFDFDGTKNILCDITIPLLGTNQTWVNKTSERKVGEVYTNDSGRTIFISICTGGNDGDPDNEVYVNNVKVSTTHYGYGTRGNITMSVIVPNNHTYYLAGKDNSIVTWVELR